jgi:putative tricarboxylic transport membrane protein
MQYHGVVLGPRLFALQPELGYGVIMAMFVTYLIMVVTIQPLSRYMSHVTMVSTTYMAPIIIAFTLVGSFVPREYLFDMYLALVFGAIGYVARRTGYHVAAILIGVILGPLLEQYFLRALRIAEGNILVIFSSTIGNVLWVFLLISVISPYVVDHIRRNRERPADA